MEHIPVWLRSCRSLEWLGKFICQTSQKDEAKRGHYSKKQQDNRSRRRNFKLGWWNSQEIDFFSWFALLFSLLSHRIYRWLVCSLCIFISMQILCLNSKKKTWLHNCNFIRINNGAPLCPKILHNKHPTLKLVREIAFQTALFTVDAY